MNHTPSLFKAPITRMTDPPSSHIAATKLIQSGRRVSQTQKIINRLKQGPATNTELAGICLKYTGRVSDARKIVRKAGLDIKCEQTTDNGVTEYHLIRT